MKVSTGMTILVLSILFYFLIQTGKGLAAEVNPAGTVKFRKTLQPSHRDKEVGRRKQPSSRLWKAAEGEAQLGDEEYDKAASNLQLGTSKQKPSGKRPFLPLSPPKSKSQGPEAHFEGHGNFNTDTYSCPGIQLKACRKPSDCDGCLGLYTCKLPKGRCDFKALSRQTGPEFQHNWRPSKWELRVHGHCLQSVGKMRALDGCGDCQSATSWLSQKCFSKRWLPPEHPGKIKYTVSVKS